MWVQAAHQNFGPIDVEFFYEFTVQNAGHFQEGSLCNGITDLCERQVGRGKRNPQSLTGEHHDDTWGAGLVREPFGVTGKWNACIIDNRLVDGSGDDTVCFSCEAGRERLLQSVDNVAGIVRCCDTWNHRFWGAHWMNIERGDIKWGGGHIIDGDFYIKFVSPVLNQVWIRKIDKFCLLAVLVECLEADIRTYTSGFSGSDRQPSF